MNTSAFANFSTHGTIFPSNKCTQILSVHLYPANQTWQQSSCIASLAYGTSTHDQLLSNGQLSSVSSWDEAWRTAASWVSIYPERIVASLCLSLTPFTEFSTSRFAIKFNCAAEETKRRRKRIIAGCLGPILWQRIVSINEKDLHATLMTPTIKMMNAASAQSENRFGTMAER